MAAMISSAEKSPGIEALETLGVNNRLDLLNKSLYLGNVRLHILLSPVQKIIIIPGMTHILEPGQQGAVLIGKDSCTDIVLTNHTDSSLMGLGCMSCAHPKSR